MKRISSNRLVYVVNSKEECRDKTSGDREAIQKVIEASENDFEKSLTFISAGALGLSLGFIEKIIPLQESSFKFLLILGWISLILTLGLNLISHMITKRYSVKSQRELDEENPNAISNIIKRNHIIDSINWITITKLLIGITLIVLFVALNISDMSKNNRSSDNTKTEIIKQDSTKKEKLGRTIPIPPPKQDSNINNKKNEQK